MKHVQHRKRGRPSLSARVHIEPVYEATPNLERLARVLAQYAQGIRIE